MCSRFHGLRVAAGSNSANSVVASLPRMIAPARFEPRHRLGVVVGNEARERLRAALGCKAGGIEDVLDSDRHAVERAAKAPLARFAVELCGGAARPRTIDRSPRLDHAVEQIDARKRRVDQLDRRELALADKAGRLRERERVRLWHRVFP